LQDRGRGKQDEVCDNTVKSYLWILRACWDWAVKDYDVVSPNPWAVILPKIKGSHIAPSKAFTAKEVRAILAGFYSSEYYRHYGDFVKFLVSIAARPGEVVPLVWGDLSPDFSTIEINKSFSRRNLRKTTKNNRPRTVTLPEGIITMLSDRYESYRKPPKPTDLIFPAPKGGVIDTHSFARRAWRTVLKSVGIKYIKFYSLRHTGISHALANGASLVELAEQVGNTPKVLSNTYAHSVERRSPFKEF
jgi:integrase